MQRKMQPQYRICFTVYKQCERCKGTGLSPEWGLGLAGTPCGACSGSGGKHAVQVLSIKREYELQQIALSKPSRRARRLV